jgi:hypothetical protein
MPDELSSSDVAVKNGMLLTIDEFAQPVNPSIDKNSLLRMLNLKGGGLDVKEILITKYGVNSVNYRLKESISVKIPECSLEEEEVICSNDCFPRYYRTSKKWLALGENSGLQTIN